MLTQSSRLAFLGGKAVCANSLASPSPRKVGPRISCTASANQSNYTIAIACLKAWAGLFQYGNLASLKGWDSIRGLQFENLVVGNFRTLLPILGIEGASLSSAAPFRRAKEGAVSGVQIDLLLQTKATAYVIEVKRRDQIDATIVNEIAAKVKAVGCRPSVSVRTALVYDGHLAPSVVHDHMIDFIIPAERLF